MENAPITVIPSSEGGENGNKEKKIERGVAVKSKLDEYREIADLTGFENLKAMILAESVMKKRKKRNRKKKKKKTELESVYRGIADLTGFDNLKAMIEAEASMKRKRKRNKIKTQENDTVNVAEEQGQLGEDEGLNKVEEKERNEKKKRRKRRKGAKLEEYEKISDLSGFENLKSMIDAEASMRRNKTRENRKRVTEFCQVNVSVNTEEEKAQVAENEAFEVAEVSKLKSIQTLEMGEPQHLVIDPAKQNEVTDTVESVQMVREMRRYDGAKSVEVMYLCSSSSEDDESISGVRLKRSEEDTGKVLQTTTVPGANDGVNCVEVIDLCSSLSEDDKPISDKSSGRRVEEMVPVGPVVMEKKQKRRRKKTCVIAAKDKVEDAREENDAKYTGAPRSLLRKPRYFDPQDWNLETCSNCGKENHTAARDAE